MFTGIVEELGTVKKIKKGANSAVFTIRAEKILDDLKTGGQCSCKWNLPHCNCMSGRWFYSRCDA